MLGRVRVFLTCQDVVERKIFYGRALRARGASRHIQVTPQVLQVGPVLLAHAPCCPIVDVARLLAPLLVPAGRFINNNFV